MSSYDANEVAALFLKSRRLAACLRHFENELSTILDSLSVPVSTEMSQESSSLDWSSLKGRLLSLGPDQVGPNMFFSRLASRLFRLDTAWGKPMRPWTAETDTPSHSSAPIDVPPVQATSIPFLSYGKAMLRGFQVATERGPFCSEPMRGVAFVLEEIFAEDRLKLETPRIFLSSDQQVQPEDKANGESDIKEENKKDNKEDKSNAEDEEDDPILAAIRAKQAAAQMRQKAQRLSSLSWLNPDGEVSDDEDDMIDDEDDWYDEYSDDNYNQSGKSSEKSSSEEEEDGDIETCAVKPEVS